VNDLIQHNVPDVTIIPELRSKIGAEPHAARAGASGLVNSRAAEPLLKQNVARARDAGRGFAMSQIWTPFDEAPRNFGKQGR
jgi:hypothetical protein